MADGTDNTPPYPLPCNEAERLRELYALDLIGGGRIEQIDRICRLARDLYKVPVALVPLVERDQLVFLAQSGVELHDASREGAFCTHAILGDEPLIIQDALKDPRFRNSPFVARQERQVRFYAGVPLQVKPGINIGTLSIIDFVPRRFSADQKAHLSALADMIVSEIRGRHAARELKARERHLAHTAKMAKIGGYEVKLPSGEITWDDEIYRIYGFPRDMVPSHDAVLDCYDPEFRDAIRARRDALATRGVPYDVEIRATRPNGDAFWLRTFAEAEIDDGRVTRIIGAVQDITKRKSHEERIRELAYRDTLTGLPNRAAFIESMNETLSNAALNDEQTHLVRFNIEHFRDINDALGHHVGDVVLQTVADALQHGFGTFGGVARVGGDEFAAIVSGSVTPERVALLTNDFIERARDLLRHQLSALPLCVRAGLATYPDHGLDAKTVIKNAEVALSKAKTDGYGKLVVFDPVMRKETDDRAELVRRVRAGIANREFMLFYQPIVRLRGRKVSGLEALMRWKDPVRGIVPASEFMPAFDEPELALALGKLALDVAVEQMRQWLDDGVDFGSVALNLSTAQFRLGDLADRILNRLAAADVPPSCLTLEVTENVYMDWGAEVVATTVQKLHAAGVGIALDDFGTGYASLSHLQQFPIDKLKIDKSFVQSPDSAAIVDAVINMGLSLGMQVVAEGVEKTEQVDILRMKGCDFVQGYVFAKPLAPDQVAGYIAGFAPDAVQPLSAAG